MDKTDVSCGLYICRCGEIGLFIIYSINGTFDMATNSDGYCTIVTFLKVNTTAFAFPITVASRFGARWPAIFLGDMGRTFRLRLCR